MQRAATLFDEGRKQQIDDAVTRAEAHTSAEIVPAVASASGRYDRAEDMVGLWLGIIAMCVTWWLLPKEYLEPGAWGGRSMALDLALLAGVTVAGFVIGAVVAGRVDWLRRLFTPAAQMREEVALRARETFFDSRVHHTERNTGLLIYVSLYERLAMVLADQAVLEKLGQSALDELCAKLTGDLKKGDVAGAICGTIEDAGARLAAVLPITADDRNEIGNALVLIN